MANLDVLPFYNYLGQIEYLSGHPESLGDWSSSTGEPLSAEQQSTIDTVAHILRKLPTEAHVRAEGLNLTLEVGFEDRSRVIARKYRGELEEAGLGHGIQKLRAEAFLLKWLVQSSGVPVPRILSFPDDQHSNILIMDKLPGTMLLNIYGTLDISAKERLVEEYAGIALRLFELDVPQRIGTLIPATPSGSLEVIPLIDVSFCANEVFKDVHQYLTFLFEMKKSSALIGADAGGPLNELRRYTERLLAELPSNPTASTLLRCVLVHRDLNDTNILVDQRGHITGIIDWEYQALHPAFLAADYPPWLAYDGCHDPRFVDPKMTFWLDSPRESERLRNLYLQIIKRRNYQYWEALVTGTHLRSCVKWLLNRQSDPGCEMMKRWMDAKFSAS